MNKQKLWWSGVEERFMSWYHDHKTVDRSDKTILSFFHKEIQNHLHEEGKEELENERLIMNHQSIQDILHKHGFHNKELELDLLRNLEGHLEIAYKRVDSELPK